MAANPAEGKAHFPRLKWFVIGASVVAILALLLPNISISFKDDEAVDEFDPDIAPAEFLYLDNVRVGAYLAELEGGVARSERLTRTLKREANANATAGEAFSIGASAQEERFVERVVTPTAASNYFRLYDDLHDATENQVKLTRFDPASWNQLRHLREGRFVLIRTHQLLSPTYIAPYLAVRQSGTLRALLPGSKKNRATFERVKNTRAAARAFARKVGPNPRMIFAVQAPISGRERDSENTFVTYLLPLTYRQLTDERSLLEKGRDRFTGGRLTIVGKVVRVIPAPTPSPAASGTEPDAEFVDHATRETWRQPLRQAPISLVKRVSRDCVEGSLRGRACLLAKLTKQTRLFAPGAVIIPVAVYK